MPKVECRLSASTKDDFQLAISQLGYRHMSEAIRDMIEIVAYNGERTPKEQFLSRQLTRLTDSLISPEATEKLRKDFIAFLKEYNYLIYFARMDAEDFYTKMELSSTESLFYMQFHHMHGYSLTPVETKQLVKHMYHDSDALKEIRNLMSDLVAIKAQAADINFILSPAEKLAIAEGGRK